MHGQAGALLANLAASPPRGGVFVVAAAPIPILAGTTRVTDWAALPAAPDLAVLCSSVDALPRDLDTAGRHGVRTAVICTDDPDGSDRDTPLKRALLEAARRHGCRFLGPGSAGVVLPAAGLHASWIADAPDLGGLAVVSPSGSIAAGACGWARARGIGLSRVIALGDETDLRLDDILDTLAADTRTRAILVHAGRFADGRAFMVAARGAARVKPVLMLWPPLADSLGDGAGDVARQAIVEAAFARAGVLRVTDTEAWFEAAEIMARPGTRRAGGMAIIANGYGPAQLAAAAASNDGLLATLAPATLAQVRAVLPGTPVRGGTGNPVVLPHVAGTDDFLRALGILRGDAGVAATVIVHAPAPGSPEAPRVALAHLAAALADATNPTAPDITLCTFGTALDPEARAALARAGIAAFDLPEQAVRAHAWRERHRRSQAALAQAPVVGRERDGDGRPAVVEREAIGKDACPVSALRTSDEAESPAFLAACGAVWRALQAGRTALGAEGAAAVLRAFDLPVAADADAGARRLPLSIAITDDRDFGRALLIDASGRQEALLPPLNAWLAADAARTAATRVALATGHDLAAHDIANALVAIAGIAVDLPELAGLELHAHRTAHKLAWRVAASTVVAPVPGRHHLALRPYPRELESREALRGGREVLVRPIRIEDVPLYRAMLDRIPPDDLLLRFRTRYSDIADAIPNELLANLARFDYSQDLTLIAVGADATGAPEALGVVDAMVSAGGEVAEFSVLVRADCAGTGLGRRLTERIIAYCAGRGVKSLFGFVMRRNARMLGLAERLGFRQATDDAAGREPVVRVILTL